LVRISIVITKFTITKNNKVLWYKMEIMHKVKFVVGLDINRLVFVEPSQSPYGDSSPRGGAYEKPRPLGEVSAELTERAICR
jgi:hypothetical protein